MRANAVLRLSRPKVLSSMAIAREASRKHALVIDVEAKRLCGRLEVGTIDEQRNLAES
jgi:hypothetical protein